MKVSALSITDILKIPFAKKSVVKKPPTSVTGLEYEISVKLSAQLFFTAYFEENPFSKSDILEEKRRLKRKNS